MNLKSEMWNDRQFTTEDLFRITQMQDKPGKTLDEEFLLSLMDKFFLRIAVLKDELSHYKGIVDEIQKEKLYD